ncbi:MAG: acyltransferase family protein [Candidatus Latescibacterota bacterium]
MAGGQQLLSSRDRLESLDVFRGITMILLVSNAFGLSVLSGDPVFGFIGRQFTHHPWHGMYFWDLIQPFFMFIVGVAMPFSFGKRWERGESWGSTFRHALRRSILLFAFGVLLHIGYSGKLVWELWNVLTQLSVTYMAAFLLMRKSIRTQIIVSFGILIANYLLYRFLPLPGVADPWEKDHNLGAFMDMVLMGKINPGGGWVAINVIGSSAHTIWGVVAGLVLRSTRPQMQKVKLLAAAGLIGVALGLALDPITPIVKRICTSSFIVESGGWALLALALAYWFVDVRSHRRWARFAVIFGMNSIFVYLASQFLGRWLRNFVGIFTDPVLGPLGAAGSILNAIVLFGVYFYLAWWLYKREIFIRI